MTSKQTILQVGGTGYTGQVIAKALTSSDRFIVKALVRPASLSKLEAKQLEALGVEIIPGDIVTSSSEELHKALQGVDTVISTVLAFVDQKPLLLASKRAGVKRVVPSDFGPHIPRGEFFMNDIQHVSLPPQRHELSQSGKEMLGTGKIKVAHIAYQSVGEIVKRIVSDPRTLNKTVQAYDGEISLEEGWALGAKVSGENFDDYPRVSAEEIEARSNGESLIDRGLYGYAKALYVRGHNTVENAINGGALDARELYPDYQPLSLEDLAKEFYRNPPTFTYEL